MNNPFNIPPPPTGVINLDIVDEDEFIELDDEEYYEEDDFYDDEDDLVTEDQLTEQHVQETKLIAETSDYILQLKATPKLQKIDLNKLQTAVEAQDNLVKVEVEDFIPTPLPEDQVEKLHLELTPVEGEPPTQTAGDILYVPQRKTIFNEFVAEQHAGQKHPEKAYGENEEPVYVPPEQANLISSECENGNHAPVLDVDLPIEVYPSSQLGHSHLYINKEMTWEEYTELLQVLAKVGIIEQGYADASVAKGYSAVRPVGVQKLDAPRGAHVLAENAKFRVLIFELRQMLEYQAARAEQNVDWDLVAERNQLATTAQELYEQNQQIQHENNQLREELNRARLTQANNAAISWT